MAQVQGRGDEEHRRKATEDLEPVGAEVPRHARADGSGEHAGREERVRELHQARTSPQLELRYRRVDGNVQRAREHADREEGCRQRRHRAGERRQQHRETEPGQ